MTFTQHGPSVKLSSNNKQPAGNSLALTTTGTEPAGGSHSRSNSNSFNKVPIRSNICYQASCLFWEYVMLVCVHAQYCSLHTACSETGFHSAVIHLRVPGNEDGAYLSAEALPWNLLQTHSLHLQLLWTSTMLTNAWEVIVSMTESTEGPKGKTILDWTLK